MIGAMSWSTIAIRPAALPLPLSALALPPRGAPPARPATLAPTLANAAAATCRDCLHQTQGHGCRAAGERKPVLRPNGPPPELSGPAQRLERILSALGAALHFPPDRPELGGVRALRLADGQAELELACDTRCGGGAGLADLAFHTLRALLPDTDIFVLPVA